MPVAAPHEADQGRVDAGDLHDQETARLEDATDLGQLGQGLVDVLEDLEAGDDIEGFGRERVLPEVVGPNVQAQFLPRVESVARGGFDAGDVPAALASGGKEEPPACTEVEEASRRCRVLGDAAERRGVVDITDGAGHHLRRDELPVVPGESLPGQGLLTPGGPVVDRPIGREIVATEQQQQRGRNEDPRSDVGDRTERRDRRRENRDGRVQGQEQAEPPHDGVAEE